MKNIFLLLPLIVFVYSCKKEKQPDNNSNNTSTGTLVFYVYDPVINYPGITPIATASVSIAENYNNGLSEVYSQTTTTNSNGIASFSNFPYSSKYYSVKVDNALYDYQDLVGFTFNSSVDTIFVQVTQ